MIITKLHTATVSDFAQQTTPEAITQQKHMEIDTWIDACHPAVS
jgi:alpha-amylase/alpha-mannosidase (GH57 family)